MLVGAAGNPVIGGIPCLASIAYQRRYIVRATKDEYVLPEELADVQGSALRMILERGSTTGNYTDAQWDALADLWEVLEDKALWGALGDPELNPTELVESSPVWARVRHAAQRYLELVRFDLEGWEAAGFPEEEPLHVSRARES